MKKSKKQKSKKIEWIQPKREESLSVMYPIRQEFGPVINYAQNVEEGRLASCTGYGSLEYCRY